MNRRRLSELTLSIHFGLATVLLQTHHRSTHETHGRILGDVVANDAPSLVIILKQMDGGKILGRDAMSRRS